jgi:hypothetical protein
MIIDISPTIVTTIGVCFVFASGMLALVQVVHINKGK